jgi:hypothetical protein
MSGYAPHNPGNLPWNWERRREKVLSSANTQNVPAWVTPYGYAPHHVPQTDKETPAAARKALEDKERELLIATQDRDLAPTVAELQENGIEAVSLSQPLGEESDDTLADVLTEDDVRAGQIIYERPTRRELWLMEQDRQRWLTGPVIRAYLVPLDEQRVTLRTENGIMLPPETALNWLRSLAPRVLNPPMTKAEHILNAKAECVLRRELYGPNWQLSLLTEDEIDAMKARKEQFKELIAENENDPLREELVAEETQVEYFEERWNSMYHNCYAGYMEDGLGIKFDDQIRPDCDCANRPWLTGSPDEDVEEDV